MDVQGRVFEEVGVKVAVLRADGEEFIGIAEDGLLAVPLEAKPTCFHLVVGVQIGGRAFLAQKDVAHEGGDYHCALNSFTEGFARGCKAVCVPIGVMRVGPTVWTSWHASSPNRVDCWRLSEDGHLDLFQVGIVHRYDQWKLHSEYRWRGQLYRTAHNGLVAKPDHLKWGSLEGGTSHRTQIFGHVQFRALMRGVKLEEWTGSETELDPPLPQAGPGTAVVQWYIAFAGQTGQGPANLPGGTAWIQGADILGVEPDEDGEVRLHRGDVVSFERTVPSKPGKPPFLKGVQLIRRDW